jgi:hypothetical protein
MGKRPTAEQILTLGKQRDNLVKSMAKFNIDSQKYLGVDAFMECMGIIELNQNDFAIEWDPIDPPTIALDGGRPEASSVALPSALPDGSPHRLSLTRIMGKELELRQGHANDCLVTIRTIIGQEAFKYKKDLRPAHDKVHRTRARSSIQTVHRTLVLHSRIYKRTRMAMISLHLEPAILDSIYRELTSDDMKPSSAVADPNVAGSSRTKLSWIWTVHQGIRSTDNYLTECEFPEFLPCPTDKEEVYRVHWLRARAQLHRWQEEVTLTQNEMHWATNYFTFRQRQWSTWQSSHSDLTHGHHAYAERQKAMWGEMGQHARALFKEAWADFDCDPSIFS